MKPGAKVRYWPFTREGVGKVGRTRSAVQIMGNTWVVFIHGEPGAVALTHVELIEDGPKRTEDTVPVVDVE